jgi:precorrin-2 dehydrogenase/sirohydrochlorin ferrochelatase
MLYPICLELKGRRVVVIGGGVVAERKCESLLEAGAQVTIVSPEVTPRLRELALHRRVDLQERPFQEADAEGAALLFAATDDSEVQKQAAATARARGIWINVADKPDLCDFIMPAVARQGDVLFAISTSGSSPALAAELRRRLNGDLALRAARAAAVLGAIRAEVQQKYPDPAARKLAFERIVDSGILDWIDSCDDTAALERARQVLETRK